MPLMPPKITIHKMSDVETMAEAMRAGLILISDYAANTAVSMHPDIIATLETHGLAGQNRFAGLGANDAQRSAQLVCKHLKKIADLTADAAMAAVYLKRSFTQLVDDPVQASIRQREQGHRGLKVG